MQDHGDVYERSDPFGCQCLMNECRAAKGVNILNIGAISLSKRFQSPCADPRDFVFCARAKFRAGRYGDEHLHGLLIVEVKQGDTVQAGIIISNSEVGLGSLSLRTFLYRLVCLNGMILNFASYFLPGHPRLDPMV